MKTNGPDIDTIHAGDGENYIFGGAQGDNLFGGAVRDIICGDFCQLMFSNYTTAQSWKMDALMSTSPTVGGAYIFLAHHGMCLPPAPHSPPSFPSALYFFTYMDVYTHTHRT